MRVVHVTLGLDVGGQEKLLVEFARHHNQARFRLHVVSLTSRGPLASDLEALGVPVTAMESPSGLSPALVSRLTALFRQLRANVVHTHDDRPNIHAAPAARLAGVPVVIHTRHHQGTRFSPRQVLLTRSVAVLDTRFVCISHDSARIARAQGVASSRLRVIHNGIDLNRFAPASPDLQGCALLVARLSPEKSIDTLLRAVAHLQVSQPDFRLIIAGDGPCRQELEQLARQLQLGEAVRFLGTVRDIPGLLSSGRLFVLPSLTEGISLTLLEAMARGLPVIATRVGGNPEVVVEEKTGLLVPPSRPDLLAQAMLRLWRSPRLTVELGMAGRERVEQAFDVRRMVADYEALYLGREPD